MLLCSGNRGFSWTCVTGLSFRHGKMLDFVMLWNYYIWEELLYVNMHKAVYVYKNSDIISLPFLNSRVT